MIAALLGASAYGSSAPRRSFKVQPANYTHPMIVSKSHEIDGWNKQVASKKKMRDADRQIKVGNLKLTLIDWGITPVVSAKTSALIRKQLRLVTGISAV